MSPIDSNRCLSLEELEACLSDAAEEPARAHLARCATCRDQLVRMRRNNDLMRDVMDVARDAHSSEERPAASPPGRVQVEGYEVLSEVHRGSQGIVFKAVQHAPHRLVALKVLLEGTLAIPARHRRFEREIEVVAALRHPCIVTVYDSGRTADGRLFFAMEFVEGLPLDRYVGQHGTPRLALQQALRLFCEMCDGVNHAHQRGVIHRDLKPANVLIDADGRPHIVDFGLAKAVAENRRPDTLITSAGQFLGTLAYAAPEQLHNDPASVDIRADVYALGVILYELLSGTLPVRLDGPLSDAIRAITQMDPAPPSRVVERPAGVADQTEKKAWPDLDTIVLKALAKSPERRYQTAAALADDVRRALKGQAIDARRDSGWYILRKTLSRYRIHAALSAGFVFMLMAFSVAMSVLYRRSVIEAEKTRQIKVFLEDTLGSVEPAADGMDVTMRQVLDEAVHWVEIALADQPEVEASLRTTIGNSYRNLGDYQKARWQLDRALSLHRGLLGDDHPLVAQSLNAAAALARDCGDMAKAEELYRRALAIRRKHLGPDHPDVSTTLQNLGSLLAAKGDPSAAEPLLRESLAIRERTLAEPHPDIAMGRFKLAELYRRVGRLEDAENLHRHALNARTAVLHEEHPDMARSRLALAELLLNRGQLDEARALAEQCLRVQRKSLPAADRRIAQTEEFLARCQAAGLSTP